MASWSRQRRLIYAVIVGVVLVAAIVVPAFLIFYKAPTCFDAIMNGKEQGVDCGGPCVRLCASAFLPPSIAWSRFERVAPGLYNVGAYIVNPNPEGEARNVPYRVLLYDNKGVLIVEKKGTVYIPPHRNTIAFIPAIDTGKRIPARASFEFTYEGSPDWRSRKDPLVSLAIGEQKYTEEENTSSLIVSLKNSNVSRSLLTSNDSTLAVYVVLYDISNNVIGFSRTYLDDIGPNESADAPFTWPFSRNDKVISIEVLPVVE